jgi:hypothetical protein
MASGVGLNPKVIYKIKGLFRWVGNAFLKVWQIQY